MIAVGASACEPDPGPEPLHLLLELHDQLLRLLDAVPQYGLMYTSAVLLPRLGSVADRLDEGVVVLTDRTDFSHQALDVMAVPVPDLAVRGVARRGRGDSGRALGMTWGVVLLDDAFQLGEALRDVQVEVRLDLLNVPHVLLRGVDVLGELDQDDLHLALEAGDLRVGDVRGLHEVLVEDLAARLEGLLELLLLHPQLLVHLVAAREALQDWVQLLEGRTCPDLRLAERRLVDKPVRSAGQLREAGVDRAELAVGPEADVVRGGPVPRHIIRHAEADIDSLRSSIGPGREALASRRRGAATLWIAGAAPQRRGGAVSTSLPLRLRSAVIRRHHEVRRRCRVVSNSMICMMRVS